MSREEEYNHFHVQAHIPIVPQISFTSLPQLFFSTFPVLKYLHLLLLYSFKEKGSHESLQPHLSTPPLEVHVVPVCAKWLHHPDTFKPG